MSKAGLDLTIKIGGCEAVKDMYEARVIGVSKNCSPNDRNSLRTQKIFICNKIGFSPEEYEQVSFLINVETISGYQNFDSMLALPEINQLDGIVIGRVDMTGSMGISREEVNSDQIFDIAKDIVLKAKSKGLECVIGGGVSAHSLPFFKKLPEGTLDRYETRKVIFKCPGALDENADKGILKAVGFELMWLKNKRDFYGMIHAEDKQRIEMLEPDIKN